MNVVLPDLADATRALSRFAGEHLSKRISDLEITFKDTALSRLPAMLDDFKVTHDLLAAAAAMKSVAGQINVTIHAVGILLCLPRILGAEEIVQSLSLGAGSGGKAFDLETSHRVAEFKFIQWRGGADTVRQNGLFKDFYLLAEHETSKQKSLYVLGTAEPEKFLKSKRKLSSIMNSNRKLWDMFSKAHSERFTTVGQYYAEKCREVEIVDVTSYVPELASVIAASEEFEG